jgi:flagellar basal body-associated protein FliL
MKKVFSIIAVAVLATSFVSCGNAAAEAEKAAADAKRIQDSIAAAATNTLNTVMDSATKMVDSSAIKAAAGTAVEAVKEAVEKK